MFYPRVNLVYRLIIPSVLAFCLGVIFIVVVVWKVHTVQQEIKNLKEHYIPAVEKSANNIMHLKNISENFVFSLLASERDMLPDRDDFEQVRNNLDFLLQDTTLETAAYKESEEVFKAYFDLASEQANKMLGANTLTQDSNLSKQLILRYNKIESLFLKLDRHLKHLILLKTKRIDSISSEIILYTIIFILVFSVILFLVSYLIFSDFNRKFTKLQKQLLALDLIDSQKTSMNLDGDELSRLSQKITDKIDAVRNLREEKTEMQNMAHTDQLTSVYNRRYLDVLQHDLQERQIPFGIMMVDIDYFKSINDTYGHDVGDSVLIAFSTLLKEKTRASDILIRYGGEEFVIILPNIKEKILFAYANRLREAIEERAFDTVGHIHASFGVTLHETINLYDGIKKADIALYRAKEKGRNRVEIYQDR